LITARREVLIKWPVGDGSQVRAASAMYQERKREAVVPASATELGVGEKNLNREREGTGRETKKVEKESLE